MGSGQGRGEAGQNANEIRGAQVRALVREELDKYTQPAADSFPYLIGAD